MISEREVDEMIKYPKTQIEKVAVPYFLLMTNPHDFETQEKKYQDIVKNCLKSLIEELSILVDEMGKEKGFTEAKDLAVEMALATNMPFRKENKDWINFVIATELSSSETTH